MGTWSITGSYLCPSGGKSESKYCATNMLIIIRYNKESNKWIALSEKSRDFMASSEVSGSSLLLGPQVGKYLKTKKNILISSDENQTWLVSNDSASCSGQAASYTARLSLSACQGGRRSGQTGPDWSRSIEILFCDWWNFTMSMP